MRGILAATGWPQLGGGKIHFGLLVLLLTLITIRYMIGEERRKLAEAATA